MKDLFVAISDVHISLKNRAISIQVLRQSLELARSKGVALVIAGDLNDTKALLRSEYMNDLIALFEEFADVVIYAMVGNHDLNNKYSDQHSLRFLSLMSNVTVLDQCCLLNIGGTDWGIIPYMKTNEEFVSAVDALKGKVDYVITHQGYLGSFMGDYVIDESSADPKIMDCFKCFLSGHYHKSQLIGTKGRYFGSPYTVNFGEAEQEKFIWTVGIDEGENIFCSPTMTNARRHVKIEIENQIPPTFEKLREDSIVQVSVKGTREFCRTVTQDHMRKALGCERVSVVPSVVTQSVQRIDSSIASEPLKIIEAYLNTCQTSHSREHLNRYLHDSCGDLLLSLSNSARNRFRFNAWGCENFLSFGSASYKCDPSGLVLIEGYDEDLDIHTGVGKSSFLDIPSFSLFGKTSKKLKVDEYINRKAKKGMHVWSQIENLSDGSFITIHRYRKHKEHKDDLFAVMPNGDILRGKDNPETQKLIEEFLGLSFETFLVSTYFTQFGSMDRFLSAPDAEKKKIIFEIQDTKFCDQLLAPIKERLKADNKTLEATTNQVLNDQSRLDEASVNYQAAVSRQAGFVQEKAGKLQQIKVAIDGFETQRNRIFEQLADYQDAFEDNRQARLSQWVTDYNNFETDRQNRVEALGTQFEQFETQVGQQSEANKGKILTAQYIIDDNQKAIDEIRSDQDPGFDANKMYGEDLLHKLNGAKSEASQHSFKSAEYGNQAQAKRQEYQGVSNRTQEATCGNCFQPISGDAIQKRLNEIAAEGEKLEGQHKLHSIKSQEITNSLGDETKIRKMLDDNERSRQLFDHNKHRADTLEQQNNTHRLEIGQLENFQRPLNPYVGQIEGVRAEQNPHLNNDQAIKAEVNPYPQQIEAKKAELNPYSSNYQQVEAEQNPHDQTVQQTGLRVNELQQLFSVHSSDLERIQIFVELGNWWKEALHVYIKSYLSDSFLMQLNDIANHYLDDLFDGILKIDISTQKEVGKGKAKKLKEEIEITIYNGNHECSYESLSGAERNKVCLCVNIAAAKVSQMTTGKSFPFLMLDESLNKNLEARDMAQVMRLLKELELEYETIFVVDHNTEFKQMFTNSLLIKKSAELSTISH